MGLLQFLFFKSSQDSCGGVWFGGSVFLNLQWREVGELFSRMSVNGRVSGSNGRLSQKLKSSWKGNESMHVSNSSRTCRKKLFLFWVFCVVVALWSVWFIIFSFNSSKHLIKETACEKSEQTLLQRYNVSRKQFHALASLFSGSDQVTCTFCFFFISFQFYWLAWLFNFVR